MSVCVCVCVCVRVCVVCVCDVLKPWAEHASTDVPCDPQDMTLEPSKLQSQHVWCVTSFVVEVSLHSGKMDPVQTSTS